MKEQEDFTGFNSALHIIEKNTAPNHLFLLSSLKEA